MQTPTMPTPMAARPTSTMATKLPAPSATPRQCHLLPGRRVAGLARASSKKRNPWLDPFDDGPDEEFDYTGVYSGGKQEEDPRPPEDAENPYGFLRFPMGYMPELDSLASKVRGDVRRVCCVVSGGVYENVLFFPVVQMLKDRYPGVLVDVVASARGKQVYEMCKNVRYANVYDPDDEWPEPAEYTHQLGVMKNRYYDMVLSTKLAGTGHALFLFMSSAREKVGYVYPNVNGAGAGLFLTEMFKPATTNLADGGYNMYQDMLEWLGRPAKGVPQQPIPPLRVSISKKLRAVVEDKYNRAGVEKGKYVVIHGIESDSVANMKSRGDDDCLLPLEPLSILNQTVPIPGRPASAISFAPSAQIGRPVEMGHEGAKYGDDGRPTCDCLLFDLDDTLYPVGSGIGLDVMNNIQEYMIDKLGINKGVSLELCILLYKQYGTTMAGLRAIGYQFDYDDFHGFVHGRLAYEKLKPDPVLRNILLSLPIRKLVFTNGDRLHASRAMKRLGIDDCFEGVLCFETLNPASPTPVPSDKVEIFDIMKHLAHPEPGVELPRSPILCKPNIDAMLHALKLADINPQTTIFFDDSIRNIQAGKQIGMHTVLVGTSERIKGADHALESLHNMKEAFPELWVEAVKDEDVRNSSKVGIETSVIA